MGSEERPDQEIGVIIQLLVRAMDKVTTGVGHLSIIPGYRQCGQRNYRPFANGDQRLFKICMVHCKVGNSTKDGL